MGALIATSTTLFQTTTGLQFSDVIAWMSGLILEVIGSGLAVLYYLMPWIIALAVLGAIIYFLYRAFRFFRH
jgi:hypothetical protein